jgi:hypothetical protein
MLAGISSDHDLRLEQGRDHHPSGHVIDALARALQPDEAATPICVRSPSRPRPGVAPSSPSARPIRSSG